jgi:hypothetical protein
MAALNRDSIAGLVLLAFSLFLAFYLTPDQVESHGNAPAALSARLFCYVTAGLLGVLSLILIIVSFKKNGPAAAESQPTSWEPLLRGLICTAIAAVYVAMASLLGFFTSTALAMAVFLVYFGVKKWTGILLFLIIVLGFIYLLFVKGLKVFMPDGVLF